MTLIISVSMFFTNVSNTLYLWQSVEVQCVGSARRFPAASRSFPLMSMPLYKEADVWVVFLRAKGGAGVVEGVVGVRLS